MEDSKSVVLYAETLLRIFIENVKVCVKFMKAQTVEPAGDVNLATLGEKMRLRRSMHVEYTKHAAIHTSSFNEFSRETLASRSPNTKFSERLCTWPKRGRW